MFEGTHTHIPFREGRDETPDFSGLITREEARVSKDVEKRLLRSKGAAVNFRTAARHGTTGAGDRVAIVR